MSGTYNEVLVLFSLLVAILASYTALDMASRVTTTQGTSAARWWLAGGAMAMGLGIWSMHFVGMLAFDLPIPLGYDLAITLYSMLAAVGVSAFALWLVSRPDLPMRLLCLGAVLMGAGIAVMHYMGMAALRMQPGIDCDPLWFSLSIVIAVAASGAALWIAFHLRRGHRRGGAATGEPPARDPAPLLRRTQWFRLRLCLPVSRHEQGSASRRAGHPHRRGQGCGPAVGRPLRPQ